MLRCTAKLSTERKPSQNLFYSPHIPSESDTFNCCLWTQETAARQFHPMHLVSWMSPLSVTSLPQKPGVFHGPQSFCMGTSAPDAEGAGAGGGDRQRKTHSLKGGSRVFAPGEEQAAHYHTPTKIKSYGP